MRMLLITAAWFTFMACNGRKMPSVDSSTGFTQTEKNGQKVYMQYCQKCHPMGEKGLGPALNGNPAPGFAKRFQVRHGLGAMPAFKKDVISKQDLDDLIKYMKARKKDKPLG